MKRTSPEHKSVALAKSLPILGWPFSHKKGQYRKNKLPPTVAEITITITEYFTFDFCEIVNPIQ